MVLTKTSVELGLHQGLQVLHHDLQPHERWF